MTGIARSEDSKTLSPSPHWTEAKETLKYFPWINLNPTARDAMP
jgi:hypothetical protein